MPKLTIKDVIPENELSEKAKNELDKIKKIEKTVDRENLFYKANKFTSWFQNFQTITTFGRDIYDGTINTKEADEEEGDLLVEMVRKKVKPKNTEKKQQKKWCSEGRERLLNALDRKIFPIEIESTGFSGLWKKRLWPF